jgi:lipocalin
MKIAIIALFALLAVSFAQNPIPLPSVNLTKAMGLWYINVAYPDFNLEGLSCYTWQLSQMNNGSLQVNITIGYEGQFQSTIAAINPSQNGAVWTPADGNGGSLEWVAADIVGYTWATLAAGSEQGAAILSRNPTMSNTLVVSQVALLQKEGYSITNNNYFVVPNTAGCV